MPKTLSKAPGTGGKGKAVAHKAGAGHFGAVQPRFDFASIQKFAEHCCYAYCIAF